MDPAINLTVLGLLLLALYMVFRPRRGWYWIWHSRAGDPERVRTEDALKHLYHCIESGVGGSIEGIAGAVEVSRDEAARLGSQLEQRGLVKATRNGLTLTREGRRYALQIIRTHRLWEHYLAEETGIGERDWHEHADRVEHALTRDEVEALSARLGDPVYDPHGDPIPTAEGVVSVPEGRPLNMIDSSCHVRIVHVEDEPEATYRQILKARLQLGMQLRVLRVSDRRVEIDTGVERLELAPLVAANITVQVIDDEVPAPAPMRRMSSLGIGERATVADILPACRGVERRRLLDLGLVPGTVVRAEFASPAGDPTAYRVRGALIALRNQQADMIQIVS